MSPSGGLSTECLSRLSYMFEISAVYFEADSSASPQHDGIDRSVNSVA